MFIAKIIRPVQTRVAIWRNPVAYARSTGVRIGDRCRLLGLEPSTFGSEPYLVSLGHHVTVTSGVRFITHDGGVWVFRDDDPDLEVIAPITIGNNVFIGINSIIMPGVRIGSNCVIGAGSIVSRDIPENSVAFGVPARVHSNVVTYKSRIEGKATSIRSLAPKDKKAFLIDRYFSGEVSS